MVWCKVEGASQGDLQGLCLGLGLACRFLDRSQMKCRQQKCVATLVDHSQFTHITDLYHAVVRVMEKQLGDMHTCLHHL